MSNSSECPCCGSDKWHFSSGGQGGEPIEPDEGWCGKCGFHYIEHVRFPIHEQIRQHKTRLVREENDHETDRV